MKKIFEDTNYAIRWGIVSVIAIGTFLSLFLISKIITEVQLVINNSKMTSYNSISVTGKGEVVAVPNIANFNFTVNEVSESVSSAQDNAAKKANSAIEYLKKSGVDEKDIKTISYNVYPKEEWENFPCTTFSCPPSNRKIIGYEVIQSVDVKVRDTSKSGEYLSKMGEMGITQLSGLNFTIDDQESLKQEAINKAIEDAKNKAKNLEKTLGIKLGKIVSYGEDPGYAPTPYYGMGGDSVSSKESIPNISVGENKISAQVYINFELK